MKDSWQSNFSVSIAIRLSCQKKLRITEENYRETAHQRHREIRYLQCFDENLDKNTHLSVSEKIRQIW